MRVCSGVICLAASSAGRQRAFGLVRKRPRLIRSMIPNPKGIADARKQAYRESPRLDPSTSEAERETGRKFERP